MGDKASADVKNNVESALANLREAKESGDIERIKTRLDALQEATYRLSEAAYQSAGAGAGPGAGADQGAAEGATAGNPDEDVIEAEYKTE
jgi:molecular chaperone DnaK